MCKHQGDFSHQVPVNLAHPREDGVVSAGVDKCIAPLVQALNDAGVQTLSACCGHDHRPGYIGLEEGRVLTICADMKSHLSLTKDFPDIHGQ